MIDQHFSIFYENIKLTAGQKEDAKKKYDGVCGKLHNHYYPGTTYSGKTRLLMGSYGKRTHVRPARDIDVIFRMPPDEFDHYDSLAGNGQSKLLQDVRSVLIEKYPDTPIRASEKVVVLEFSEPNHNVELLPAWEKPDGSFKIPDSKGGGNWETSDPKREIDGINESDEATGVTRQLIRMIKKWTEQCSVQLKSYEIELAAIEFLGSNPPQSGTAKTTRDFFTHLHGSIGDDAARSHLDTARKRANKACDFDDEGAISEAVEEWTKIFGNDFPKHLKTQASSTPKYKPIENPPKLWLSS